MRRPTNITEGMHCSQTGMEASGGGATSCLPLTDYCLYVCLLQISGWSSKLHSGVDVVDVYGEYAVVELLTWLARETRKVLPNEEWQKMDSRPIPPY